MVVLLTIPNSEVGSDVIRERLSQAGLATSVPIWRIGYRQMGITSQSLHRPPAKPSGLSTVLLWASVLIMLASSDHKNKPDKPLAHCRNSTLYLLEHGIETRVHYPVPIHMQEAAKKLGYSLGSFPVTEPQTRRILSVPVYPELTDVQRRHVVDAIERFYEPIR